MRIFLAATSFRPDYGGPAVSVSRLGAALAQQGHSVGLWAPDGSAVTSEVVVSHSRLSRLEGDAAGVLDSFGPPDLLHDSGVWLPHNHILATLSRKRTLHRIVSPRGMLEPWALNHKWLKKRIAWLVYERRDLQAADALHATSEGEAEQLSKLGLGPPKVVIPNGVDIPDADVLSATRTELPKARGGSRTALFLSRVHPKKGLPMLLEAWAELRPEGWQLIIAGPSESRHETFLRNESQRLGLSNVVVFLGPQYGRAKAKLFLSADLFVLPTHSENFGIAIAEALAHETPVLTTTGTPWASLSKVGAGWCVAPTTKAICMALQDAVQQTPSALAAMGRLGRIHVQQHYSWEALAHQMTELYEAICNN